MPENPDSVNLDKEVASFVKKTILEKTHLEHEGCPYCGHDQFETNITVRGIPAVTEELNSAPEDVMAYFEFVCARCSASHFFNLHRMEGININPNNPPSISPNGTG